MDRFKGTFKNRNIFAKTRRGAFDPFVGNKREHFAGPKSAGQDARSKSTVYKA